MFPLMLKLENRLAVVVGGGPVGRRKAHAVLAAGARVRLVCLEPRPADESSPRLEWLGEPFRSEHLDGAVLVFAAATPDVNRQVVSEARRRGLWVNCAAPPSASDFYVPAVVRQGDFTLAISTEGAAPGLAQQVRLRLAKKFDEAFGQWVALLAEMRPLVQAQVTDPSKRRQVLRSFCQGRWLVRLRRHGLDAIRQQMLARMRRAAGTAADGL